MKKLVYATIALMLVSGLSLSNVIAQDDMDAEQEVSLDTDMGDMEMADETAEEPVPAPKAVKKKAAKKEMKKRAAKKRQKKNVTK